MNIIRDLFNVGTNLMNVLVTSFVQLNSAFVSAIGFVIMIVNAGIDFVSAIGSIPLIGSLLSPIINPLKAILNAINGILQAIQSLLQMITSFCSWIQSNLDISTYLAMVFLVAISTLFPVVSALIGRLPTPLLVILYCLPFAPIAMYLYLVYIANTGAQTALQFTEDTIFNIVPLVVNNIDIIIYFGIIIGELTLLENKELYELIKEILPKILFLDLLFVVVGITALPLLFFAYYYFVNKTTIVMDNIQKIRQNLKRACLNNLDLITFTFVGGNLFLILNDEATNTTFHELLPEYLYMDLTIFLASIVIVPVSMVGYFMMTQGIDIFSAISTARNFVFSIGTTLSNLFVTIFKIQMPQVTVQADPNPGLKPAERLFFAQLFGDNLAIAPYTDTAKYPFYANLSTVTSPVPLTNVSFSGNKPGTYSRMSYEDLNMEFYGDPNYQKSLYYKYFSDYSPDGISAQGPQYLTRVQYIALPYNMLTDASVVISSIDNLIFQLLNINQTTYPNVSIINEIPDALLKGYAMGGSSIDVSTIHTQLTATANSGYVLPVLQLLLSGNSQVYDSVSGNTYADAWMQNFCLQIASRVPGNMYQLAYQAIPNTNATTPGDPVYQTIYNNLNTISIGGYHVTDDWGCTTVWYYAFAAAQQANLSTIINDTSGTYNVYADFLNSLNNAPSGPIAKQFLIDNNNRDAWIGELYKLITGQSVPSNVCVYELMYKSLTPTNVNGRPNVDMSDYSDLNWLNNNHITIQDVFTLAVHNIIDPIVNATTGDPAFDWNGYNNIVFTGNDPKNPPKTNDYPYRKVYSYLRTAVNNAGAGWRIVDINDIAHNSFGTAYNSNILYWAGMQMGNQYTWYPFNGGFSLYHAPALDANRIAIGVYNAGAMDVGFMGPLFSIRNGYSVDNTTLFGYAYTALNIGSLISVIKNIGISNNMQNPQANTYDAFPGGFDFSGWNFGAGAYHKAYAAACFAIKGTGINYAYNGIDTTQVWQNYVLNYLDLDGAFGVFASQLQYPTNGDYANNINNFPKPERMFLDFIQNLSGPNFIGNGLVWTRDSYYPQYTRGWYDNTLDGSQVWYHFMEALSDLFNWSSNGPWWKVGWDSYWNHQANPPKQLILNIYMGQMNGVLGYFCGMQWWFNQFMYHCGAPKIYDTAPNNNIPYQGNQDPWWSNNGNANSPAGVGSASLLSTNITSPYYTFHTNLDIYSTIFMNTFLSVYMNRDRGQGMNSSLDPAIANTLSSSVVNSGKNWFKPKYSLFPNSNIAGFGFGSYLVNANIYNTQHLTTPYDQTFYNFLSFDYGYSALYNVHQAAINNTTSPQQLVNYMNSYFSATGYGPQSNLYDAYRNAFYNNWSANNGNWVSNFCNNMGGLSNWDLQNVMWQAVQQYYNYNVNTMDGSGVIVNPYPSQVLSNFYSAQWWWSSGAIGTPGNWFVIAYNLAYRASYLQVLLTTGLIAQNINGVSNMNAWSSTWPYKFVAALGHAGAIDYGAIFKNSFLSLTNQIDNNWIGRFYTLARKSIGDNNPNVPNNAGLNQLMYKAACNVMYGKDGANAQKGYSLVNGQQFAFRYDMPNNWVQAFKNDYNYNLKNKCISAFQNILNLTLKDPVLSVTWPYQFISLIGANDLPSGFALDYGAVYKSNFYSKVTSQNIGSNSTWLTNFYNLVMGSKMANNNTLMGKILCYGFDAASTITTNLQVAGKINWLSLFFQNSAQAQAYSNTTSSICYNASAYGDPASTPWPSAKTQSILWPNLSNNNVLLQPSTTDSSGNAINQPTNGQYNGLYLSYCNACYIQNSLGELKMTLSNLGNSYGESMERFNIYASKWGLAPNPLNVGASSVGTLTNPNFTMTLSQIEGYTYTFANGTKNIVLFNDFVPYRVLPASNSAAQSGLGMNLDNIFSGQVISLESGSSPTSSSNLFAVADTTLELVANGIPINILLGLYNNLRKANVDFLFNSMSTNSSVNPGASLAQTSLLSANDSMSFSSGSSGLYNSGQLVGLSALQGLAQTQHVLEAFTQSINTQMVAQAIQDAPGQNGTTTTASGGTQIKDYGGPYIRRLFYDAAAVFDSIYTDLFQILQNNVCKQGNIYMPNPNDPIDMIWFRYNVQNWQNPFNGAQYGDGKYNPKTNGGDGKDSYVCRGYKDGGIHSGAINSVLAAFDNLIYTNPTTGYPGIYTRLFSLLDYVTSYNNIISQVYSNGQLGSNAIMMQNQLQSKLSNKYLRLGQNNQYMDLTSLCAGTYQHFHLNLPLNVPVYSVTNQNNLALQNNIAKMSISSVADLGRWLSQNISYDPNYTGFKNEIATTFIFKSVWDLIWWPQFCYEYYYRDGNGNPSTTSRFPGVSLSWDTPSNHFMGGRIVRGAAEVSLQLGQNRFNSQFFPYNNSNSNHPKLDSLRTPAGNITTTAANILWEAMCYSYQHDAMLAYMFFTSGVSGQPANYTSINFGQNYNSGTEAYFGSMDSGDYNNNMANDTIGSTALSSYEWLSKHTCIGGTALPAQVTLSSSTGNAPSLQVYSKFAGPQENHAKMRQQFFADPLSWIDTTRAYQIYPLSFGTYPQNTSWSTAYAAWIYQNISPLETTWACTVHGQTQYVNTLYKMTQISDVAALNPNQAYAQMIDISQGN